MTDPRLRTLESLARELLARGHQPECTTGSGPCERCARAYAGRQILEVLARPTTRDHIGPSWTTRQEWSDIEEAAIGAYTLVGERESYPMHVEDAVRSAVEALGGAVASRRATGTTRAWPTDVEWDMACAAAQVTDATSEATVAALGAALGAIKSMLTDR